MALFSGFFPPEKRPSSFSQQSGKSEIPKPIRNTSFLERSFPCAFLAVKPYRRAGSMAHYVRKSARNRYIMKRKG